MKDLHSLLRRGLRKVQLSVPSAFLPRWDKEGKHNLNCPLMTLFCKAMPGKIKHPALWPRQWTATCYVWKMATKKNTATPDCSIWGECSGAIPGSHSLALQVLRTWIMPSDTKQDASSEEAHLLLGDISEYSPLDVSGESKDRCSVKLIWKPKWKKTKTTMTVLSTGHWDLCHQAGTSIHFNPRVLP